MNPLRLLSCLLAILFLASAAGCRSRAVELQNPMRLALTDPALVRTTVADILERMSFELEHPPRDPARTDTYPLVSAYFLEFWRPEVRTDYDRAEAAIHTMRRTVTVYLRPARETPSASDVPVAHATGEPAAPAPGAAAIHGEDVPAPAPADWSNGIMVEVVVRKERLDLGHSFIATDMNEAYGIFRTKSRFLDDFDERWGTGLRWIDFGRDPALEHHILARLRDRL